MHVHNTGVGEKEAYNFTHPPWVAQWVKCAHSKIHSNKPKSIKQSTEECLLISMKMTNVKRKIKHAINSPVQVWTLISNIYKWKYASAAYTGLRKQWGTFRQKVKEMQNTEHFSTVLCWKKTDWLTDVLVTILCWKRIDWLTYILVTLVLKTLGYNPVSDIWLQSCVEKGLTGWQTHWLQSCAEEGLLGWLTFWLQSSAEEGLLSWWAFWLQSCAEGGLLSWWTFWLQSCAEEGLLSWWTFWLQSFVKNQSLVCSHCIRCRTAGSPRRCSKLCQSVWSGWRFNNTLSSSGSQYWWPAPYTTHWVMLTPPDWHHAPHTGSLTPCTTHLVTLTVTPYTTLGHLHHAPHTRSDWHHTAYTGADWHHTPHKTLTLYTTHWVWLTPYTTHWVRHTLHHTHWVWLTPHTTQWVRHNIHHTHWVRLTPYTTHWVKHIHTLGLTYTIHTVSDLEEVTQHTCAHTNTGIQLCVAVTAQAQDSHSVTSPGSVRPVCIQ